MRVCILCGDQKKLERLLADGADPNSTTEGSGDSMLMVCPTPKAAHAAHPPTTSAARFPRPLAPSPSRRTIFLSPAHPRSPLRTRPQDSAVRGKVGCMRTLIEHKADIHFRVPSTGFTAVLLACTSNQPDCLKLLLDAKASPDGTDERGAFYSQKTHDLIPVRRAILCSAVDCLDYLLVHGARRDKEACGGEQSAVEFAARCLLHNELNWRNKPGQGDEDLNQRVDILSMLLASDERLGDEQPLSLDAAEEYTTLLSNMCAMGSAMAAQAVLLHSRVDPDASVAGELPPLLQACNHRNVGCVRALLECGANPALTHGNKSAMSFAKQNKDAQCIKLLIEALRRGQVHNLFAAEQRALHRRPGRPHSNSPACPLHLPCISPASPLHLPCTPPAPGLLGRRDTRARLAPRACSSAG